MEIIMGIILLGIIALVVFNLNKRKATTPKNIEETPEKVDEQKIYQYYKKTYFFTKNEFYFYKALKEIACELELEIFPKVRLADIIEPPRNDKNWQTAFNKIKAKHIDFVLCENQTFKPKLVIELDDKSHITEKRIQRDQFVDEALKSAHLQIIHTYGTQNLKDKIIEALNK